MGSIISKIEEEIDRWGSEKAYREHLKKCAVKKKRGSRGAKKKKPHATHVTDHAVIRLMERVKNYDVEAMRAYILAPEIKHYIERFGPKGEYPHPDGFSVVVQENTIVTVKKHVMPYQYVYVPADVFLEHNGVKIYHVYKNDDVYDSVRQYWFSLVEDSSDNEVGIRGFDVRELDAWNSTNEVVGEDERITVLKAAIDSGELKNPEL